MLIYSPSNGGFDSAERSYSGFTPTADRRVYQLRPANPVRCSLLEGDLISITCSEAATSAWLIPFDHEAQNEERSLGLENPAATTKDNTAKQFQVVENVVASDLHRIHRWLDANGASHCQCKKTELRGYRVFDAQSNARTTGSLACYRILE